MGKVKVKKADVWIDMTPMSDVMVLLLTFFMLTSTFVKNEAVKVVTPGSVSEYLCGNGQSPQDGRARSGHG